MTPLTLRAQNTKADISAVNLWLPRTIPVTPGNFSCSSEDQHKPMYHCLYQLRLLREEPQWCWCLAPKVSTGWVLPSKCTGGDTFPRDSPDRNHANHAPCRLLTSQRRQHVSPPECDPATSSDTDIQGLFAKRLNAALGPWVVHQMFTCTDICLCWSSWFSSHYIIYQATDVIINAQTSRRRRLKYKFDFLVVWGHYSPDCTLLLN